MKKVLILGGGGFIGMGIARYLSEVGDYDITIADRVFRGRIEEFYPNPDERAALRIVDGDFSRPGAFQALEDSYDHFYMMAATVGVNNALREPEEVIRNNTALVHYSLEWLAQGGAKKILFASSSENYAGTTDAFGYRVPTPEEVPLCIQDVAHPRFAYAVTKMLGESAFLNTARKSDFDCSVIRYQNVFGPFMGFSHAIPHLVQRFHQKETPFKIYGTNQTRAFCYITDAAEGTVKAMESNRANGEVYHLGNTEEISIETLTRAVGKMFDYSGEYIDAPTYPGSCERRCPDITKSREHLDFEPKIHWEDGLVRTVKWYRSFFESGKKPYDAGFEPPDRFANRRH
jgi:nucleoside-diphosphate-sugar epimerase